jgi:hypothetical protein
MKHRISGPTSNRILLGSLLLLLSFFLLSCTSQPEAVQMHGVEVSSLDKGARWLSTGVEEIDALDGISESDRATVRAHLVTLIENQDLRHDEAYHADLVSEL